MLSHNLRLLTPEPLGLSLNIEAVSRDNRTATFRVLGKRRSPRAGCRVLNTDVNRCLDFAAPVAAGLHGMEKNPPADPLAEGNAYLLEGLPEIPPTLREPTGALDGSGALRGVFGDAVINRHVGVVEWDQADYDRRATNLEIAR